MGSQGKQKWVPWDDSFLFPENPVRRGLSKAQRWISKQNQKWRERIKEPYKVWRSLSNELPDFSFRYVDRLKLLSFPFSLVFCLFQSFRFMALAENKQKAPLDNHQHPCIVSFPWTQKTLNLLVSLASFLPGFPVLYFKVFYFRQVTTRSWDLCGYCGSKLQPSLWKDKCFNL